MPTRSLQTRIVALFLALTVFVQLGGFLLVNSVGMNTARKSIGEALVAGGHVFERARKQEVTRLEQAAQLLSADAKFRHTIGSRESASISSILEGYGKHVGAELLMLIRRDDVVIADTLGSGRANRSSSQSCLRRPERLGRQRRWSSCAVNSINWSSYPFRFRDRTRGSQSDIP